MMKPMKRQNVALNSADLGLLTGLRREVGARSYRELITALCNSALGPDRADLLRILRAGLATPDDGGGQA